MGVCLSRTPRITPPRREGVDIVYSIWEEPNFSHRTARKASPVPQEEMSLTDRVNLPRRSGEGMGIRPNRTPRIAPPRREGVDTAYSGWEEMSFTRQSARKPSLDPQEEMRMTDYEEHPPITQRERRSDQENPVTRVRTSPEPPPSPPLENETFRRNRPSRYSMETPSIRPERPDHPPNFVMPAN